MAIYRRTGPGEFEKVPSSKGAKAKQSGTIRRRALGGHDVTVIHNVPADLGVKWLRREQPIPNERAQGQRISHELRDAQKDIIAKLGGLTLEELEEVGDFVDDVISGELDG